MYEGMENRALSIPAMPERKPNDVDTEKESGAYSMNSMTVSCPPV